MTTKKWLKKYTELRFLNDTLKDRYLHLGSPNEWEDKNDFEAIRIFSEGKMQDFPVGVTCLTRAPDRFHFWHVFGKRELGVCLWFCEEALLSDIEKDESLILGAVNYPKTRELSKTSLNDAPFTKREQYGDEREFRVIRIATPGNTPINKFRFSPSSLRKIYLNPWLSPAEVKKHKRELAQQITADLNHVKVLQNQSLLNTKWIEALSHAVNQ
ncbi:MAG: hypothetical protein AAF862_13400 [Pseudomonadota bacterium]